MPRVIADDVDVADSGMAKWQVASAIYHCVCRASLLTTFARRFERPGGLKRTIAGPEDVLSLEPARE
jgi:hypothetical protein